MIIWMTNANFQIMEERLVIQSTPFKLSKKFLLILRIPESGISRNFPEFQILPKNSPKFPGNAVWSLKVVTLSVIFDILEPTLSLSLSSSLL